MKRTNTYSMDLVANGAVTPEDIGYARHRIEDVIDRIEEPVLFARLKLTLFPDPARDRPGLAEVTVDVNGDLIRAHVEAENLQVAADLLKDRLASRLRERVERFETRRRQAPSSSPGKGTQAPRTSAGRSGTPELVQRGTYTVQELTPEEAVLEMEMLEYDFHLFHDAASGRDALIERDEDDDGFILSRLEVVDSPPSEGVSLSGRRVPTLNVDEAIDRLETLDRDRLFFADASGRGNVLYRRDDGNYGLVLAE